MLNTIRAVMIGLVALALVAGPAWAATGGELTVEPPTLTCAGFHWEVTDDSNANASAGIEFRRAGEARWRKGLDFMRFGAAGKAFVAGSLFDLEPATQYQARITLADPDGVTGEATKVVTFTTRSEPKMPVGGKRWHIYPPDHNGKREAGDLGADWREVIADVDAPIKPGDVVLIHAGRYKAEPVEGKTVAIDTLAKAPRPTMPQGGTTWHVYPPGHKGPKLEPMLGKKGSSYWAMDLRRNRSQRLKRGDTILVHAGVYKVKKHDYRDRIFQAPRWGSWRIWHGGDEGKPIRVKSAGDGPAIFDGDGNYLLFETIGSGHLWLDGLTIRNVRCGVQAAQDGFGSCRGLTITDCTFEDVDIPLLIEGEIEDLHVSGNTGLSRIHRGPGQDVFGTWRFRLQGKADRPIVLKPAGDGEVVFDGGDGYAALDVVDATHLWFDGLTIEKTEAGILAGYYPFASTTGLIVTGCTFRDLRNGIYDDEAAGSSGYYIADNAFKGRTTGGMNDHSSPFGIFIAGRGHIVAHNRLENFQDCVSTGWDQDFDLAGGDYTASMDIMNNVMIRGSDDLVEMDKGMFNIRAMRNLFFDSGAPALSMQGGPGGAYYWIRNIAIKSNSSAFKMCRNMFVAHNVITAGNAGHNRYADNLHFRNNIFLPFAEQYQRGRAGESMLVQFSAAAPANTSDYNAYRMLPDVFTAKPFGLSRGRGNAWSTLEAFSEATGLEANSILLQGEGYVVFRREPETGPRQSPRPEAFDFRLKPDAGVIDKGGLLPNINDDFRGDGPDMGAIEFGDEAPHYGPRSGSAK